ncbi:MAG: hypothetical protein K2N04_07000, partial [Alistipes sp.]|nr:hypothetical protein [Alistipes sp.]
VLTDRRMGLYRYFLPARGYFSGAKVNKKVTSTKKREKNVAFGCKFMRPEAMAGRKCAVTAAH